ncbi:MAG: Holliday junction branch migration protein RuvA [Clostridia bacterium]|nr:Holliday junction branch migration protein RuvA [Clostridia bacterium]
MYYYIRGKYVLKGESFVVIDAGGVGYKIYTSASNLEKMPSYGSEITIYTHLHVREDAQDLYGFITKEEITLFLQLMSVSGIGPKAALSILSVTTPEQFALAVITNDVKTLTKAQGVGPKAAQRIILELKDKIKTADALPEDIKTAAIEEENNQSEAVTALVVLGYTVNEAKRAVSRVDPTLNVELIIKEALKILMKQV